MPKISVIVPVYKAEKYLDRCVQSILNQTFEDLEVILVDDGSPDRCPEMCDKWAEHDSRIKVLHQINGGASAARNAGLRVAQGEYIGFVDSDDWIESKMYEVLHNLICDNDADMAISEICRKSGGEHLAKCEIWDTHDSLDNFFRINGERDTHTVCTRLIKKNLFNEWEFVEGRMNEDVHACYCLSVFSKKTVYTNKQFYHYFQNSEGVTNRKFSLRKTDLLYMWDVVLNMTKRMYPEYIYACEMNQRRACFTLLMRMRIDGYDKNDYTLKKLKRDLKKNVRGSALELLKWKMPISRKVFVLLLCVLP